MIETLFKKNRIIGTVGNAGTGKTSLNLNEIIKVKEKFNIPVCVLGVEENLIPYLESKGIVILQSKEDILDLKIKNSLICIEEFGDLFSTTTRDKQLDRLKRFFNRIDHLNDYLLISSARENFWNKMMCGVVKCFLIKEITYDSLTNGTTLKRKILGLTSNSDYRLEMKKEEYFIVTEDEPVKLKSFKYNKSLDSKKENINPFEEKE